MKKTARLLLKTFCVIVCLLFIMNIQKAIASAKSDMEGIENFNVDVVPNLLGKTTNVTISWVTRCEVDKAIFNVAFNIDGSKIETPFDFPRKDNSNCSISEINILKGDKYYHIVSFDILSGKVGTARLDFTYSFDTDDNEYEKSLYIVTGNPNVGNDAYHTSNIVLASILITVAAIAATYLIILVSEKSSKERKFDE